MKHKILTGKDLIDFKESANVNKLVYQSYLGIYSPSIFKIEKSPTEPIDRLLAALIRFGRNNPEVLTKLSFWGDLGRQHEIDEFKEFWQNTPSKKLVKVSGIVLDLNNDMHLGTIMFRGYTAAKNLASNTSGCVLSASNWIAVIIFCINNNMAKLIEQVISEELEANKLDASLVLSKSWPRLKK